MSNINNYYSISSCTGAKWLKGSKFAYVSTKSGVNQIWEGDIDTREERQLTFFNERIWRIAIAPNHSDLFFTMDIGGNEQEQIYVLKSGMSEAVNLTNNNKARHQFGGVKPDGKTIVYSCNARNPVNFDICQMDTETGEAKIVVQNSDSYNTPAALSKNGRYILYNKLKGQSDNCLWIADLETGFAEKVDEKGEYAQYTSPVWNNDSTGFYLLTDVNSSFIYLAYYDIGTKQLNKIYGENWDIEAISLSKNGKYLALLVNRDGFSELEIMSTKNNNFISIPRGPKGVSAYYGIDWAESGNKLLYTVSGGTRPCDIWMIDLDEDMVKKVTYTKTEGIERDELVEPTLHHFKSFDGLTVPYWFFEAPNSKGGVVFDIHGGPEGQERPSFSPLTQYLISQGLSVVAPNIRGSVGYGKEYHHLDDVEKRLDSIKDIAALAKHIVDIKLADKDKIAVMGVSYGGYSTLASITEHPELWACAVDTVGMSNLETFLENTAEYRRAHRESEYGSLAKHRDVLRRVSPMHKVDKITAPLMVIHGANDPRVPVTEADQIVASLRNRGAVVEYLRYEDEGHGLSKRKNQLDCYPQVAAFLKKYLEK